MSKLILSAEELASRIRAARQKVGPVRPGLPVPEAGSYYVATVATAMVEPDVADERKLTFVLATSDINRNGWQLNSAGWQLENYLLNPVMLWVHDAGDGFKDSGSHGLPFANAERCWVEGDLLKIACRWVDKGLITGEAGELAESVLRLYRAKFLHAVSAGWIPLEYEFVETDDSWKIMCSKQELVEASFVPIPAEPRALRMAASAGLGQDVAMLRKWASSVIGEPRYVLQSQASLAPEQVSCIAESFRDFYPGAKVLVLGPEMTISALDDAPVVRTVTQAELAAEIPLSVETAGVCPKNVSTDCAAKEASWSAPTLGDFTDQQWADCDKAERRRISGHYCWAAKMPPEEFDDLKLPHHEPHSGKVVWRGCTAAMGRLMQMGTDIPHGDLKRCYDHLKTHYEALGEEAPEFHYPGASVADIETAARTKQTDLEEEPEEAARTKQTDIDEEPEEAARTKQTDLDEDTEEAARTKQTDIDEETPVEEGADAARTKQTSPDCEEPAEDGEEVVDDEEVEDDGTDEKKGKKGTASVGKAATAASDVVEPGFRGSPEWRRRQLALLGL